MIDRTEARLDFIASGAVFSFTIISCHFVEQLGLQSPPSCQANLANESPGYRWRFQGTRGARYVCDSC